MILRKRPTKQRTAVPSRITTEVPSTEVTHPGVAMPTTFKGDGRRRGESSKRNKRDCSQNDACQSTLDEHCDSTQAKDYQGHDAHVRPPVKSRTAIRRNHENGMMGAQDCRREAEPKLAHIGETTGSRDRHR